MKALKPVLLALIAAFAIKFFFFDFIIAQGNSMEPAIKNGDVLVVSRLRYGIKFPRTQKYLLRWDKPRAGEVVVFYTPEGELAVKRCVSAEGTKFSAEGDNSLSSYDSRAYGQVSAEKIIGKVLGR